MANDESKLKVMVVDDTSTYRMILKEALREIPNVDVPLTAIDGEDALEKLQEHPANLVLLDMEMPRMNGLEALMVIRSRYPDTGVVMISGVNQGSANATIKALEAGALDFIRKPDTGDVSRNLYRLRRQLEPIIQDKLRDLGRKKEQALLSGKAYAMSLPSRSKLPASIDLIVIAISTGGPKALGELIPALPGDLGVPILIVQHMPPLFTASLAASLNRKAALNVVEAQEEEPILPNHVYIAPGGRHMVIRRNINGQAATPLRIDLDDSPPENSCRPAADVLFRSVADVYGKNILAVVMTGMGNDGAKGVQALKQKGSCYCLSQSAESCTIYGMPRSIDEGGLSDEQIPLQDLAGRISMLVKQCNA